MHQQHKTEPSTVSTSAKLSAPQEPSRGRSVSSGSSHSRRVVDEALLGHDDPTVRHSQESLCGPGPAPLDPPAPSPPPAAAADSIVRSTQGPGARPQPPPPQYPASEASRPTATSLVSHRTAPPPFSSLFASFPPPDQHSPASALETDDPSGSAVAPSDLFDPEPAQRDKSPAPAYEPPAASSSSEPPNIYQETLAETKRALPQDTKGESSSRPKEDDAEPPPAYSEGYSPLQSFTYLMAAAGGASSIITQVQQGGPPINTIGDVGADETITMDLRGTRFVLSRDELLTLPEFVLLSLFPNGLFPEGHMGGSTDGDAIQVDYMLEFFRKVASSIPAESSPPPSQDGDALPIEPLGGAGRDDSSKRAGIIVLREDLDFYVIPPKADIQQPEMIEVKRAAARALLKQDGIFSGLKRSDEPGTTEAHLIEMLTAGLALARLRSDIRGNEMGNNAVGMAQKLLLFWRKPARRCWWEGVELDNVEGVQGKLKVWIRRVWTLEMSVIGLR
ncbi:hypothetical protein SLS63_010111 [Diaporthe eres]|uniref:General stress response protein Whi2 n=1 Tax=Diaporthe eres TaxID=83184 RepID=A0ABR1NXR9_DIAER